MKRLPESLPDALADADESVRPPCAEAFLAATLALMTGFAEHCAASPLEDASPKAPSAFNPAVPHLLAAKAVSNLFFLAEHPALSAPLRSVLWRLHCHWQAIERRSAVPGAAFAPQARPAESGPAMAMAAEPWIGGEPARVWH